MSSTPTSPTSPSSPSDFIFRVILSYGPQHDGQIPLTTGDIVTDVKDLGNGWILGRNVTRNCVGIFPAKCIRPMSDVSPQQAGQVPPPPPPPPQPQPPNATPKNSRNKKTGSNSRKSGPIKNSPAPPSKPQRVSSIQNNQRPKKVKLLEEDRPRKDDNGDRSKSSGSKTHDIPQYYQDLPGPGVIIQDAVSPQSILSTDSDQTPTGTPPRLVHSSGESVYDPDLTPSDVEYNSLPTPKRGHHAPAHKPHMVVKPNQGNKADGRMEPIIQESSSQEEGEDIRSQSTAHRHPRADHYGPPISASKIRTTHPPGQLALNMTGTHPRAPNNATDTDKATDHDQCGTDQAQSMALLEAGPTQDRSTSPITVSGIQMERTASQIERTNSQPHSEYCQQEFENMANETAQQSPYIHRRGEKYASINKQPHYRDYRTLECPADGNSAQLRYKPILKKRHQKVADSKGQHIYYHEEKEKNKSFRLILSILAGMFFGLIMFMWMYYYLEYPFLVAVGLCSALSIILITMFALSRMCRCMAAILIPSLCTTRGRISFMILITGFLLGGPVTNVYLNMSEVSRSMSCSAEQTYNQTMLLLKPFDVMMIQLNKTIMQLQQSAHKVHSGLDPLDQGLDMVEMDIYNGKIQLLGTRKTCMNLVNNAYNACSTGIYNAQNQCLGVMGALGTVYHHARDVLDRINPEHWAPKQHLLLKKRQVIITGTDEEIDPLELPNTERDICEDLDMVSVCSRLNDSDTLCQPSNWAGEAIQEAINTTQDAMEHLERALRFQISSEPYNSTRERASNMIYRVQMNVTQDFAEKTTNFELVINVVLKIMPIAVLILVYVTYNHVKLYLCSDTYDNTYVTEHFKLLDQKRSEVAGDNLLPLKRYERNYLIDATSSELSPPEDGLYRIGLCVLTLHLMLSFICYTFDYILYWTLSLIARYARPNFDPSGRDSLNLVVSGEGVIADLLKVFLHGFHPGQGFGFPEDRECLARPTTPSVLYLLVICFMYFGLLLTILLKAYILRFRNRITGFFYPERRKARIVHLYNVILNQRTRMPKLLHQRARLNYREQQITEQVSFCHQVGAKCAPCRVFLYKSSQCLVCHAIEDQSFRDCDTEKCYGIYCAECFDDLGRICPLCLQGMEYSDDEEMYEELEDDLQPYHRSSKIYL